MELSILSLNVRGLNNPLKRNSIFEYLRDQRCDVFLLQETYSQIEDEKAWSTEWGRKIHFSHGSTHSRGSCILFHPKLQVTVESCFQDSDGRVVLLNVNLNGFKMSIVSIYAPTDKSKQQDFLTNLVTILTNRAYLDSLVVGGDWNVTLEKLDKQGGRSWKPTQYSKLLKTTLDELDVCDIFRKQHPKKKMFTFESQYHKCKSRIDFVLISNRLKQMVKKSSSKPSISPDHKAIFVKMKIEINKRGPGFWKFNNKLLEDEKYVKMLKKDYINIRNKYEYIESNKLRWELIKADIRLLTMRYSKQKAKLIKNRETNLFDMLSTMDKKLCNLGLNAVDLDRYEEMKQELEDIYKEKGERSIFRSKSTWAEKGEKPTKYFFNLEKTNYNRKVITELKLEDGTSLINEKEILKEIENFYRELYESKGDKSKPFSDLVKNLPLNSLSEDEKCRIEQPLTRNELRDILKSFANNKTPGSDGLTKEFYEVFFDEVVDDLQNGYEESFETGEFSVSQRQGVITLIPKEDCSTLLVENWRPITLLNIDYKIIAKLVAKRIETVLQSLIHCDQTGFVKNRYIGQNIRLINDVMEYLDKKKQPGILLAIDFKKAFDSLEWTFIRQTLKKFNFGPYITRWVDIMYTNVQSAVLNNGFSTAFFNVSRGVRQGCPLSPFLFILCAEILACGVKNTPGVSGIDIYDKEIVLSQFADDTTLFCRDIDSVKIALEFFDLNSKLTGLEINKKKTKALWMGSLKDSKQKPLGIKWTSDPIRILGIYSSYNNKENDNYNFQSKLLKMKTKLNMWSARDLTLYGKVLIVKSLGISQIIYSMSMLNTPEYILAEVNKIIFKFLWNNKQDKVKRDILYQDYSLGGLRMVNIYLMNKALRLSWIGRLLKTGDENWKWIPEYFFKRYGGLNFLLKCNYDVSYIDKSLPIFYRNLLAYFKELKDQFRMSRVEAFILFNNKDILIGNEPVFWNSWYKYGVISVQDLIGQDGALISFKEFSLKYSSLKTNFLQFYQITRAIPKQTIVKASNYEIYKKYFLSSDGYALNSERSIKLKKMKSKNYYNLLLSSHRYTPTGFKTWSDFFAKPSIEECNKSVNLVNSLCKDNKVRQSNFKLLHRIVFTRKELYRSNLASDSLCCFCYEEDSIEHCFLECMLTRDFILSVEKWFKEISGSSLMCDPENIIFAIFNGETIKGVMKNSHLKFKNHLLMFIRHYLVTSKIWEKKPSKKEFVRKFKDYCNLYHIYDYEH